MSVIKKSVPYFFSVVISLFFFQPLLAQVVKNPFYNFKTYTIYDGLSSNSIKSVYQDSKGFLWIGTDRGVQRFSGSSFLSFRHINDDSSSISNDNISTITEDKQQNIWIASFTGITKFSYSNGRLTNYTQGIRNGHAISLNLVFNFFEDSRGRRWIGTGSGLFLFDNRRQQFVNFSPAPYLGMKEDWFQIVSNIQETIKDEIIFSVKDGFVIIDKEGKQQYIKVPVPADKKIVYLPCGLMPFLKDHPDEVWITSCFNGLFKYDRVTKKWEHYISTSVQSMLGGKTINWSSNEWITCFNNSAYIFNHRTGIFTKAFNSDKIVGINDISRDHAGNLWLASGINGLYCLNSFTQLFSSTWSIKGWGQGNIVYYDSSLKNIYSVNPYDAGEITGLNTVTNTISRDGIPGAVKFHNVCNNFIADNNILYFARWGDMCQYNLTTRKFNPIVYKSSSPASKPGAFFEVCKSALNIYFSGKWGGGGPFMYNKQTGVVTDLALLSAKKLDSGYHSYSLCFSNNVLYAGMNYGDSIYCYNEITREKYAIAVPAGYSKNLEGIRSLCVDTKGNLWCSSNGIYIFNIPSQKWIRHINQKAGYFPSVTSQLICDENGNVWANSSEGLYVFNTDNFLFKKYGLNDGLYVENNWGYLSRLSNHQLLFGNVTGDDVSFGIINTKRDDEATPALPISITNLKVMGNPFLVDTLLDNVQQIVLPPNQNAFSLNYAAVSITAGKNLLYSYMLEDAEKNWHDVGNEQSLSYLNLSPGKYTLHIKCKSLDEKLLGKERLLYFTLLPAWYQTWWFKLLMILIVAASVFLVIKYYLREQIKKQQAILEAERSLTEERNRIAADMHDDVGAGLSRIRYITASMKDSHDISDADIEKIVSLSDESVEKMNEIIWALNQGNQQLDELIYYTRSQCSEMVSNAGLAFSFELPENIPAKTIGWKDCRNIYLLVKESVNNAIKHAGAKTITIECSIATRLTFSITDDGVGFNADASGKNGNGLLNYKKRIGKLNGTYQLITAPGKGTSIIFTIPLDPVL